MNSTRLARGASRATPIHAPGCGRQCQRAFLVLDPSYPAARLAEYVRIARPAAHLHLSAAGDLPGEVAALLDETIRTRVVLRPRRAVRP